MPQHFPETQGYAFRLTGNRKVGPIPVTRSPRANCPDSCAYKGNGCYAENAPLVWAWADDKLDFDAMLKGIRTLAKGQLWRHNEAGDLPGVSPFHIHPGAIDELILANKGKRGFTYTHYNFMDSHNRQQILKANHGGFTINVSADNVEQADLYMNGGAPVVVVLPLGTPNVSYTPAGNKIVACPAEKSERVTCARCALCQKADRDYIIGFRAHGTRKKLVSRIALQEI